MSVDLLALVHELLGGGKPGPEGCRTRQLPRAREASLEEVTLDPMDGF